MERISVIIPTLNEEKYLRETLDALANQTLPRKKYEILISDGKSTDRTRSIAKRYADKIVVSRKRGISVGLNAGIRAARGDVLAIIHADTLCPSTWLERLMKDLQGCDMVYGPALYDTKKNPRKRLFLYNAGASLAFAVGGMLGRAFCDTRNCGYRKSVFEKNGLFHEETPADDILYNVGLKGVRVRFDPRLCVFTSARRELTAPGIARTLQNIYTVPLCMLGWMKNADYRIVR